MAKTTSTATWQTIDPDTLPVEIYNAYSAYKAAYADMKAVRVKFEQMMAKQVAAPSGKRLVFGYNFGKLSVALVDAEPAKADAKGTLSLSAFLASQSAQGKRT